MTNPAESSVPAVVTEQSLTNAGDFSLDAAARKVRGLLIKWGEQTLPQHSNPTVFERGSLKLPADFSAMNANREHNRHDPIARFTSLEDTDLGLVAEFAVAATTEGDEFLEQYKTGKLRKLSAEVRDIVHTGINATAVLTGAAFVSQGAFASAALFSLDADAARAASLEAVIRSTEAALENARALLAKTTSEAPADEAEETPTDLDPEDPEKETAMADAVAPDNAQFSAAPQSTDLSKDGLFNLIVNARKTGDESALVAMNKTSDFALSDIKIEGTGSIANNVIQPTYLGELWAGRSFTRKVTPLLKSAPLTAMAVEGWKFDTTPVVSRWAGNKTAIPSGTATTVKHSVGIQRFAAGWDIGREFIDLGQTEVIDAFLRHAVNSYARESDNYVLERLVASATPVVAETFPSGVNAAMGKIVQGALAVIAADATPTSALVATDVYKTLAFMLDKDKLAFLNAAVGLEEGSLESFKVVPHTGLAAGQVLVFDKNAATVHELGGSPIRVSALDIARGGVDEALHGYVAVFDEYNEAIVLVSNAS